MTSPALDNVVGAAAEEETCHLKDPPAAPAVSDSREFQTGGVLLFLLCAVCFLEGGDEMLLPATACILNEDLGISLTDLGQMSLAQGLFQATSAPLWGILAGRHLLTRKAILVLGCTGWGVVTLLMGTVGPDSLTYLFFLRACNGAMLACLTPICQGIVADTTSEDRRGRIFGITFFAMNAGKMSTTLLATNVSHQVILGMKGWRMAFFILGVLSLTVSVTIMFLMQEPEHVLPRGLQDKSAAPETSGCRHGCAAILAEARRLARYFSLPTFCVIIIQGVFGSVPSNALGFDTMYFQVAGLGDSRASVLSAARLGTIAFGNILGGWIGDSLSKRWPGHGRALTAQISVFSGIPLVILIFAVLQPSVSAFPLYLVLVMTLGLLSSWCGTGVNYPILSEIVEPEERSVIVAWDRALEGSSAALFGARLVSTLASSLYGYNLAGSCNPSKPDPQNAQALGKALATATALPWVICLGFYTVMHWSYPRDMKKAAALHALDSANTRRHAASAISLQDADLHWEGPLSDSQTDRLNA